MKEILITLEGYKTVGHIHVIKEGRYIVVINNQITGIGGPTLKAVMTNTKRAIKRRG